MMKKFRIVQLIHEVDQLKNQGPYSRASIQWVIEKKVLFGWKEVFSTEIESKRIAHKKYADAEAYLIANYMGNGMCKRINNEYHYKPYNNCFY